MQIRRKRNGVVTKIEATQNCGQSSDVGLDCYAGQTMFDFRGTVAYVTVKHFGKEKVLTVTGDRLKTVCACGTGFKAKGSYLCVECEREKRKFAPRFVHLKDHGYMPDSERRWNRQLEAAKKAGKK